jgi:glycogen operon protein
MQAGDPALPGATPDSDGVNFAVYSSVAEAVELCLFDAAGHQVARIGMPDCDDGTWHGYVPGCRPGQPYGYRVHGPWKPEAGQRCNPAKLLLDPYCLEIAGDFHWHDAVYDHDRSAGTETINTTDNAPFVPKSVVCATETMRRPRRRIPWAETVIYETNVRGYTMRHPAVAERERGTFAGLHNREVLDYIRALGVTSVELMPVQAWIDERHLTDRGLRNYWGYNPVAFFAPMPRLAAGDPRDEFLDMVNAIHDAGLEVILDVVFNHTGEGDSSGPTLAFRGLDNAAWYRLEADDPQTYVNDTGTGNTLNVDHPRVQQLVVDCLRYWAGSFGVDGFRFDLATIIGRHADGFSPEHPLLQAISNDAQLSGVKLIAEPWDPGPGGYQLGRFPAGWAEWNDRYRDTLRRYWRSDAGTTAEFAQRLHGSADLFDHPGREPYASVNYGASHDGFTLGDAVSYEHRHNEANGENNRDGHAHNFSCNHGIEGSTDDTHINAARRRHRLNLLASVLLSQGTPMLLAGDEFGNSQGGNNNAYAQDNETGWLDWSGLQDDPRFTEQVRDLVRLRRDTPLLRLAGFLHDTSGDAPLSITWLTADGERKDDGEWSQDVPFQLLLSERIEDAVSSIVIAVNRGEETCTFRLPVAGLRWQLAWTSDQAGSARIADTFAAGPQTLSLLVGGQRHPIDNASGRRPL